MLPPMEDSRIERRNAGRFSPSDANARAIFREVSRGSGCGRMRERLTASQVVGADADLPDRPLRY
jgi:hypothetical protein